MRTDWICECGFHATAEKDDWIALGENYTQAIRNDGCVKCGDCGKIIKPVEGIIIVDEYDMGIDLGQPGGDHTAIFIPESQELLILDGQGIDIKAQNSIAIIQEES